MHRTAQVVAWGIAGVVVTGALTGVAVEMAGHDIGTPVRPLGLTTNRPERPVQEAPEPREGAGHDRGTGGGAGAGQRSDDHGDSTSGSATGRGSVSSGSASDEGSDGSGGDQEQEGGDDD